MWKRFERLSKAAVFEMFFEPSGIVQFIGTFGAFVSGLFAAFRITIGAWRGIIERRLAHQLIGALTHVEIYRSHRASSSGMVSTLIMPRSALTCERNTYFPLRFPISGLALN